MTRKEAIEIINRENDPNDKKVWEVFPEYREALDMAIKALSKEPSRDIEEIAEIMKSYADAETKCKMISNILTAKPHYFALSQEPKMTLDEAIIHAEEVADSRCDKCGYEHAQLAEWLKELKAYKEQEPCTDAVSREAVINIVKLRWDYYKNCIEAIEKLPSVKPTCEEREKGECPYYAG
ncbi:MAG: hypothetical protein J6S67_02420 [Methanobrevibacter sp.]|nr:hypothetical protein [Methanobrevibacter sp.]